jgi:hypothetical protein
MQNIRVNPTKYRMHSIRRYMMILNEAENVPLIVVDVQPAYAAHIIFPVHTLMEFINQHGGQILMFVNAEDTGVTDDTKGDIIEFWVENGLNEDLIDNLLIVDKGYAYMRAWMDFVSEDVIIRVARTMIQHDITDSRQFEEDEGIPLEKIMGQDYDERCEGDPLIINWVDFDTLRRFGKGYLCGGGRNECLAEVRLMMDILAIPYRLLEKFIY